MRHRMRGRKLGRNSSHRKAMFQNMAASLIRSLRVDEDNPAAPKVPGRIVTTLAKAKELRPQVEKLVTMARKARVHEQSAAEHATSAARDTSEWQTWREGEGWRNWANAKSPAIAARRRAFAILRDKQAVSVLFDEVAERFTDRDGGYTRVVRLPTRRLGDGGQQAIIEFCGERDKPRSSRQRAPIVKREEPVVAPEATVQPEPEADQAVVDAPAADGTAEAGNAS